MAATLGFDELNKPEFDSEAYIKEYFKPMRISEERKEEREEAAHSFLDVLLFILTLISMENEFNALDWAYIEAQFRKELKNAALEYSRESKALDDYIAEKAEEFIRVTQSKDLSDPYWTSEERATMEAVNEANDVVGYEEWQKAIDEGYEYKIWHTERDTKVRRTHQAVEGKKLPIKDMFEVGNGLMRYPHDWYYNPDECYNCRCALDFADKTGKIVKNGKKVQFTSNVEDGIIKQNYAKNIKELTTTVDGFYHKEVTPELVYDNLETSPIGRMVKEEIENTEKTIEFDYNTFKKNERGTHIGDRKITLYMMHIKSPRVGAQTIIHEFVHAKYDIGGCQLAEAICMAFEKMHIMNRDWITMEEWEYVVGLAKANYEEYQWIRGGYGDYEQFGGNINHLGFIRD